MNHVAAELAVLEVSHSQNRSVSLVRLTAFPPSIETLRDLQVVMVKWVDGRYTAVCSTTPGQNTLSTQRITWLAVKNVPSH